MVFPSFIHSFIHSKHVLVDHTLLVRPVAHLLFLVVVGSSSDSSDILMFRSDWHGVLIFTIFKIGHEKVKLLSYCSPKGVCRVLSFTYEQYPLTFAFHLSYGNLCSHPSAHQFSLVSW